MGLPHEFTEYTKMVTILSFAAVMDYDLPKSKEECRAKLREEFMKHRNVQDIRVIDMLVIKVNNGTPTLILIG